MASKELTLQDFRSDFARLVVRHSDKKELKLEAKKLIENYYSTNSQLRRSCLAWLQNHLA